MVTEDEKVTEAPIVIAAIKASVNYAAATDVQTATAAWATETANLTAGATNISNLEKELGTARAGQLATARRWGLRRVAVISAIDLYCDGSKDKIASFGAEVATPTAAPQAGVPVGLAPFKVQKSREAGWQWYETPKSGHGFMVQHATNPADATTLSAPMFCSKRSFRLLLQTPGATLSLRVSALDPTLPTGQSDWSAWVAVVVAA